MSTNLAAPSVPSVPSSVAPPVERDELLTVSELAAILKCPPDSVYNLTRARSRARSENPVLIIRMQIGLRFSRREIEEWITAQRVRARVRVDSNGGSNE